MVIGLLSAIVAGPAILGTTEGVRLGQDKNKKEEHRGRRCNLIVSCVSQSPHAQELNGKQIVLRNGKLYVGTDGFAKDGPGHPFEGYYVPFPDTKDEGLASSIDERQPPFMNWIYVDTSTYEVKYGVRAEAQGHLTVPFDCTKYDRRLTLQGWEGFVALQQADNTWALYYDGDRDGLAQRAGGKQVLPVQLVRSEKRQNPVVVGMSQLQPPAQALSKELQEMNQRKLRYRTGAATIPDFRSQKAQRSNTYDPLSESLQVRFDPPFDSTPSVAMGLTRLIEDKNRNMRLQIESKNLTQEGFEAEFFQWYDSTIYEVAASWFATTDPDFQIGYFNTWEVRSYTQATQNTQKRINFERSFEETPKILCWLNYLDITTAGRFQVSAWTSAEDKDGFTVHVNGWDSSVIANSGCCWIAYPQNKQGVDKGWAYTTVPQGQGQSSVQIVFNEGVFSKPPGRVKVGLFQIDLDNMTQSGIKTEVANITAQGFEWKTEVWQANGAGARMAWIALE